MVKLGKIAQVSEAAIQGKIAQVSEAAIQVLINLTRSSQNEGIRRQAANSLGEIAPAGSVGSEVAIQTLLNLIQNTQFSLDFEIDSWDF